MDECKVDQNYFIFFWPKIDLLQAKVAVCVDDSIVDLSASSSMDETGGEDIEDDSTDPESVGVTFGIIPALLVLLQVVGNICIVL